MQSGVVQCIGRGEGGGKGEGGGEGKEDKEDIMICVRGYHECRTLLLLWKILQCTDNTHHTNHDYPLPNTLMISPHK